MNPVGFSHRARSFLNTSFLIDLTIVFQGRYESPHFTGNMAEAQRPESLAQSHTVSVGAETMIVVFFLTVRFIALFNVQPDGLQLCPEHF